MADVELSLDEKQAEFLGEPPPAYPSVVGDAYLYQPQAEAYPVGVGVPAYGPYVAPTQVQTGMYFPTPQNSAAEEEQPIRGSGSRGRYSQNAQTQMAFNDKSVRMAFVRKVYGILLVQLFLTAAVVCVFMFVNPVRRYCQWHMWPVLTAMCIVFVLLIVLACYTEVRRRTPWNYGVLFFFTLAEGTFLGTVTVYFSTFDVLLALAITTFVVIALTLFAFQTKFDFTICSGCLFVAVLIVLLFGVLCLIFQNRYLDIGLASIGGLIFSLYIVFDTQMMLGGKHTYSLSPEEYIFAALNLYLDIVNLFLLVLVIIGCARL